jgi:hypothetical protein
MRTPTPHVETPLNSPVSEPAVPVRPALECRPTVDEMGEWSFPASDPPATWTWDVERPPRDSLRTATVGLPLTPRSHDHGLLGSTQEVSHDGSAPSDCAAAGTPDNE